MLQKEGIKIKMKLQRVWQFVDNNFNIYLKIEKEGKI